MEEDKLNKTIAAIFEDKYVVPLYQRNFAWTKFEIEQLLQDIYESYKLDPSGNYYIGSLVVLKHPDDIFEVIDGQQRLTVLTLISKVLGVIQEPKLTYDSREEVEIFFDEFFRGDNFYNIKDVSKVTHLIQAVEAINESRLLKEDKTEDPDSQITINTLSAVEKQRFTEYFANKVILVRVEIPEETDVASYFEIMNNRGEQLQKHEIVKSLIMSKIEDKNERFVFAQIWDACSQMDIPIQKLFSANIRKILFGDNYNKFTDNIEGYVEATRNQKIGLEGKKKCLSEILQGDQDYDKFDPAMDEKPEKDIEDGWGQKSIIDFPNFLMHVFKLEYDKPEPNKIALNEKYLLTTYRDIEKEVNPIEFIGFLLYYRTIFDRFIVKTSAEDNHEEGFKWILQKPEKYEYKPKGEKNKIHSIKFKNSFEIKEEQDFMVQAISMLQVRFRTRVYKDWLYDILYWIAEKYGADLKKVSAEEYLLFLHQWMLDYWDETINSTEINLENDFMKDGTRTPHFIFFFIDYLYWVAYKKGHSEINHIGNVRDFDFKYYNSVEHHFPRHLNTDKEIDIKIETLDLIGNLCLISKSVNSRLSNQDAVSKAKNYIASTPKRKIMYQITSQEGWAKTQIEQHSNDIITLLEKRREILLS